MNFDLKDVPLGTCCQCRIKQTVAGENGFWIPRGLVTIVNTVKMVLKSKAIIQQHANGVPILL